MIANEPCVAYFRIQEHVHKSVPRLVEKKVPHINNITVIDSFFHAVFFS